MRLGELEEMMTEDAAGAEAVLGDLTASGSVEELARIARAGRVPALKLRAIEALGELGGPAAGGALVEMLEEAAGTPFLVGGTEQRLEHDAVRDGLVRSVARAHGVPAPSGRDSEAVAGLIEECRRR